MSGVQAVTATTISAAIVFGMVLALLGSLKLALARRPESSSRPITLLLIGLNLALIPLMIAAGMLVDFWGVRPMLIFGSVVLALSFLALSAGPAYWRTVLAVLCAALGAAGLGVATLVLMPFGLFGKSESAASLQLGLVLMAMGGLITPPLVDLLIRGVGFRRTMAILAFLFLTPAFLAALTRSGDLGGSSGARLAALEPLIQDAGVLMAGLVFCFYAPLEAFVGVWTVAYLVSADKPHRQSAWLASFWAGFLASRVLFALIQHVSTLPANYSGWFLFFPALLSAVVLGHMLGTTRSSSIMPALILLGFSLGPVFPVLVGMYLDMEHVRPLPGTSFGLLHAFGSVGSLILSPAVKLSARDQNIQTAMRIPLFIALLLTAASLLFVLLAGRVGG